MAVLVERCGSVNIPSYRWVPLITTESRLVSACGAGEPRLRCAVLLGPRLISLGPGSDIRQGNLVHELTHCYQYGWFLEAGLAPGAPFTEFMRAPPRPPTPTPTPHPCTGAPDRELTMSYAREGLVQGCDVTGELIRVKPPPRDEQTCLG